MHQMNHSSIRISTPQEVFHKSIENNLGIGALLSKEKIEGVPKFFGNIHLDKEDWENVRKKINSSNANDHYPTLPFEEFVFGYTSFNHNINRMCSYCLYVKETGVNEYDFIESGHLSENKPNSLVFSTEIANTSKRPDEIEDTHMFIIQTTIFAFSERLLKSLRVSEVGKLPPTSMRIAPYGAKPTSQKLRNVYIFGKNYNHNLKGVSKKDVQWSHRWPRMGHWRTLNSDEKIGKDRNGVYHINGATWVTECTPGNGPLKASTRIIT